MEHLTVTARNFITKYTKQKTVKESQNSGKYNQERVGSLDTHNFFSDKQQLMF